MTTLAHQTLVEHQILEHVKDALRLTLETKITSVTLPRKLSTVRFMAESFERHVERLLALEEDGGYLTLVRDRRPALYDQVIALRGEHGEFRSTLAQIVQGLNGIGASSQDDEERFHGLCHKLHDLLTRLDEHDAREIELLEQVLIGAGENSSASLDH